MEKARELMAEAGVDGFDMEITYAAENPVEAAFAPLLQDAYGELGVNVTLTPMPFNQQWDRSKGDPEGRQDMFLLLYWPTYSDAGSDNLASLFKSSHSGKKRGTLAAKTPSGFITRAISASALS
jgi:peptide/nickel transport system substrate-binding protein